MLPNWRFGIIVMEIQELMLGAKFFPHINSWSSMIQFKTFTRENIVSF